MNFPDYHMEENHLSLERFREMDYLAVERFNLPVELMMENAGLHLARLAAYYLRPGGRVLVGAGPGNNGGGGMVAARRLAGWGFRVRLDIPVRDMKELPRIQLERAKAAGAVEGGITGQDIFIDAYLGFSQRLPLPEDILRSVEAAKTCDCPCISLDIPTGFDRGTGKAAFKPDAVLTLAAMKTELLSLPACVEIYVADLGIPGIIYEQFGMHQPVKFRDSGVLRIAR